MALTPEEQAELQQLETEVGHQVPKASPQYSGPIGPPAPGIVDRGWDPNNDPKALLGFDKEQEQLRPSGTTPKPVAGMPPMVAPSSALPGAMSKLAAFLGKTAPRRIGTNATMGAIQAPEGERLAGAGKAAALAAGGEGLGKLLGKIGDPLMQIAVGRKKYTPGVGTTLANEGIVGTRAGMGKQVEEKLGQRAQEMGDLANAETGKSISSPDIANEISSSTSKPMQVPGAAPSAADAAKLSAIENFTNDIASRGSESTGQALKRRMAAGQRAYRGKEDPLQSLVGDMSKKEQQLYSAALKEAVPEIAGPDAAFGALKRAQKGLGEELSLPRSAFQAITTPVNAMPGGSLATSMAGQAATKGGQLSKGAVDPAIQTLLRSLFEEENRK